MAIVRHELRLKKEDQETSMVATQSARRKCDASTLTSCDTTCIHPVRSCPYCHPYEYPNYARSIRLTGDEGNGLACRLSQCVTSMGSHKESGARQRANQLEETKSSYSSHMSRHYCASEWLFQEPDAKSRGPGSRKFHTSRERMFSNEKSAFAPSMPSSFLLIAFVLPTVTCIVPFLSSPSPTTQLPSGTLQASQIDIDFSPNSATTHATTIPILTGKAYENATQSTNFVNTNGNDSIAESAFPKSSRTQHLEDSEHASLIGQRQQSQSSLAPSTRLMLETKHVPQPQQNPSSENEVFVREFKYEHGGSTQALNRAGSVFSDIVHDGHDDGLVGVGNQSDNQSNPALYASSTRATSDVATSLLVASPKTSHMKSTYQRSTADRARKIIARRLNGEWPRGLGKRKNIIDHDDNGSELSETNESLSVAISHDSQLTTTELESEQDQMFFAGNKSRTHQTVLDGQFQLVSTTPPSLVPRTSLAKQENFSSNSRNLASSFSKHHENVSDNLVVQWGEDNAEYEDHKFGEYDDLFLSHDYRRERSAPGSLSSSQMRQKRSLEQLEKIQETSVAEPLTLDKVSQVRTIYFGGFFPWLADERLSSFLDTGDQRQRAGHGGRRGHQQLGTRARTSGTRIPIEDGSEVEHKRRGGKLDRNQQHSLEDPGGVLSSRSRPTAENQDSTRHPQPPQLIQQQQIQQLTASTTGTQFTNSETRHQLGKFILPAVRLALDHINTNRSILSAYKLEVVPRDTQCNATISLKQFFDMVYEEPKKMLLYGDACRVSTDPIAKASYFFDLIQISYADTDPIYTIENYPNFFRVVPSENALSFARIPFIRHFNWTRVGTIYQNLPRYSLPHSKLLTDLERFQIVIKQSVSLPGSVDGLQNRDLGDELRKLKDKDVRIILGNFDEEWALLLFCEAYRENMIGRKYQWLLTGFSEAKLWHFYESKGSTCTKQELLIAMDGYIITDITPVTRSQRRTISGLMAHEYLDEYRRRAREMSISIEENKFYGYVYDGIWAIALALDRVDSMLRHYSGLARQGRVKLKAEFEGVSSLLDFQYHQPIWVRLIRDALNATRFEGVTGTVSFRKNERPGLITFSQFQAFRDMNEVIIGSYDALSDQLDLNVGFPIIWRGSSPPIDYTIQRVTPFRINRTLFVIISILALLGIVLACVFLFINIKFRNQRYIKMSSPYLNNLIIIGCILTFTSVIILGLDSGLTSEYNFPYICNARAWVLMAGFTLAFGSMFSKTFRVHSIFTNIKLHKKVIKDYKLFMVVFILLTFDVCILIVWQYFDPFYRETNNGTSLQDPDNEDVIIVPEMEHCQSKRMTIFLSVIYVYKGLLMAFGCFLAWETRHVSIPALNDSKYIGLSVYNVVIMCVIGASLSFVLRDQQDASFVIISIFIIFCSTTTLCLVFVPKLIELKQNPRATDHRVRATLKTFKKNYHDEALAAGCRDIHGNIIGRGFGMNLNERIKILAVENVKQRSLLKEKTYELEALTSKYRKIQSMVQSGQFLQAINTSASATLAPRHPAPAGTSTALAIGPALFSGGDGGGFAGPGGAVTRQSATSGQATTLGAPTTTVLLTSSGCGYLRNSPVMSSTTQITNTTATTTSLNNTDFTADFSSTSRAPISTATTSGQQPPPQQQQQHCGSDDGEYTADLAERVQAISRQVAASKMQQAQQQQHQAPCLKPSRTLEGGQRQNQTAAEPALRMASSQKQRLHRSQESLDLFTILSHVNKGELPSTSNSTNQTKNCNGQLEHDARSRANNGLGQWLEGPFCTVMLRQTSLDRKWRSTVATGAQHRQRHHQFRKQWSQLAQSGQQPLPTMIMSNVRQRLPRTLSMIEYLGLNDFDLIARRHEKILRYRRNLKRLSCCASCSCCLSAQHHQTTYHSYQTMETNNNNTSNHMDSSSFHRAPHFQMSDGNLGVFFSSNSDLLNCSDDFLQTTSLISCSTCCSSTSHQTYASHSDLYRHHDAAGGGNSLSGHSQSATTSNSVADSSRTISSSLSESSSIVIGGDGRGAGHLQQSRRAALESQSNGAGGNCSSQSSNGLEKAHNGDAAEARDHGSLCTSGVLYGAPGTKEDANEAAAHVSCPLPAGPIPSTSGAEPASVPPSTLTDNLDTLACHEQSMNDAHEVAPQRQQSPAKLSIKCDIQEDL